MSTSHTQFQDFTNFLRIHHRYPDCWTSNENSIINLLIQLIQQLHDEMSKTSEESSCDSPKVLGGAWKEKKCVESLSFYLELEKKPKFQWKKPIRHCEILTTTDVAQKKSTQHYEKHKRKQQKREEMEEAEENVSKNWEFLRKIIVLSNVHSISGRLVKKLREFSRCF